MPNRRPRYFCAVLFVTSLALSAGAARAESAVQKECSEKYQAAKTANTLAGQTYNQFYKTCAAEAKAEKGGAPAPTAAAAPTASEPAKPAMATPTKEAMPAAAASAPAAVGEAVFPSAVAPSYASLKPGKARMQTCLDQYHKNKTANGNGGLKWIEKGGGYYSECNKRLKG